MTPRPVFALLVLPALLAGCGHVVRSAPNYGNRPFDFRRPPSPCSRLGGTPDGETVDLRYLGAGGLAIGWRGETVLAAPFFSNYGLPRVIFGHLSPNGNAIKEGMTDVPRTVSAIFAGHSHYDHLGDLPVVASHLPRARIYVNDSGARLLKPFLGDRVESLQPQIGTWVRLRDAAGRELPVRVLPLRTEHAPHVFHYLWGRGEACPPRAKTWEGVPVRALKAGTPLAFVIDLLDAQDQVRYRIYYQDASSGRNQGIPTESALAQYPHEFDLAVLCIASYNWVEDAPRSLLNVIRPHHVLAIHYEDFFKRKKHPGFVTLLTDGLANGYLKKVENSLKEAPLQGPVGQVCGPSAKAWTMPLPGEEIHFRPGGP